VVRLSIIFVKLGLSMSDITLPDYLTFATELQSAGLAVNPAEIHGLLTGML